MSSIVNLTIINKKKTFNYKKKAQHLNNTIPNIKGYSIKRKFLFLLGSYIELDQTSDGKLRKTILFLKSVVSQKNLNLKHILISFKKSLLLLFFYFKSL